MNDNQQAGQAASFDESTLKKQVQQFYEEYHKQRERQVDPWMATGYWPQLQGRVLEIGAGTRTPDPSVIQPLDGYVAFDLAFEAIRQARGAGLDGVVGEGEHLPFHTRSFDTVACIDVLEHVVNPEAVIQEMCRVSRKRIIMCGPNYIGTRFGPSLNRYLPLNVLQFLLGDRNKWYRVQDYQLRYDKNWSPDRDAISAVNSNWVTELLKANGFNHTVVKTWTWPQLKHVAFFNQIPVLKHLGVYMVVVASKQPPSRK